MRGYTKQDIDFHREGYGDRFLPAVKVKVYNFPTADMVIDRFGCCESTAKKLVDWAWESQQEHFWNEGMDGKGEAHDSAEHHLGHGLTVHGEGRSSGWVVVNGLPDADEWDGVALQRWAMFEREVRAEVKYLCSWEAVEELIDMNKWAVDPCSIQGMVNTALDAIGAP